jgi:hypothetical protein
LTPPRRAQEEEDDVQLSLAPTPLPTGFPTTIPSAFIDTPIPAALPTSAPTPLPSGVVPTGPIVCGGGISADCQLEYDNNLALGDLGPFFERCRTEGEVAETWLRVVDREWPPELLTTQGGSDPLSLRCELCCEDNPEDEDEDEIVVDTPIPAAFPTSAPTPLPSGVPTGPIVCGDNGIISEDCQLEYDNNINDLEPFFDRCRTEGTDYLIYWTADF